MKKLIVATAIAAVTVTASLAFAGAPIRGMVGMGHKKDCTADARSSASSSSSNKLMGGLTHSTEKCSATSASGSAGSLPDTTGKTAQSGTAMTINGNMAASSSASSVAQPQNVLKIKTKSNIKNDRVAASSSASISGAASSAPSPH